MIYSKIDGTTSQKFKVGKDGPVLESDTGKLKITEGDSTTVHVIGVSDIRMDTARTSTDIPTGSAVHNAIDKKIRTVELGDLSALLQTTGEIQDGDYIFLGKNGGINND